MSNTDSDPEFDQEAETHAYKITRKLFVITLIGTAIWSGVVAIFFIL